MENKKKTRGFVKTPDIIVDLMHKYLDLSQSDSLLDCTAGLGTLFKDHPPGKCFGIEIDDENYTVVHKKYPQIKHGDIFELKDTFKDESFDAVILNPPYGNIGKGKCSVDIMTIALEKLKPGKRFAIINQSNFYDRFKNVFEVFKNNIEIEFAYTFDNNLFQPFATVKTLLICGKKQTIKQGKYELCIYSNENIQVNKRAKVVEPVLLEPIVKKGASRSFWNDIAKTEEIDTRPTEEDFKKTILDYMSFESGIPRNLIENPEKLWKGINILLGGKL